MGLDALKALSELWPMMAGLGCMVLWLIRMGWRVDQLEKRLEIQAAAHAEMLETHAALEERIFTKLEEVGRAVARIEGRLEQRS